MRHTLLCCLLATACGGGDDAASDAGPSDTGPPPPWEVNATLVDAPPEGLLPAGKQPDGSAILPGGRLVTPAGAQIEVGGFLLGVRILGGGAHLLTTDGGYYDEYLTLVDPQTGAIVQQEPFRSGDGEALFLGLAVRADGHVFVSGGGGDVIYQYAYDAAAATPLTRVGTIPTGPGSYPAGLAFASATELVACLQNGDAVVAYDTASGTELGRTTFLNGDVPYDVAVDPVRQEAYVSLWGGGGVAVLDLASGGPTLVTQIATGKNPEALLLDPPAAPTRLFVANSDSDTITVIDLDTRTIVDEVEVAASAQAPRGTTPNHLALSPAGDRLYVANAGENCVDAFDTATFARIGRIPTAWYPTAVATAADGTLYVTNAKGLGGGPSTGTGFDYGIMKGTVSIIPPPTDAELAAGVAVVDENLGRPARVGATVDCPPAGGCRYPLPPEPGLPTPIEHVVLIVRENKTYDATLGDLEGANGDPSLTLFGEFYTPNLHALARAFVNGDNFYSNAEASIQGHQWVSGGTTTDFTEKTWLTTWGRGTRSEGAFATAIASPEQGYYFQHLARAGIEYVDYGEIVGFGGQSEGDAPVEWDAAWPGGIIFNLDSKDVDKAVYFADLVQNFDFLARFSFVLLPNNHTEGLSPGEWTPEYMVADNDEATGRMVDAISHSRFWYTTIIFIIEDDPQDGADHVEAHRSTLVVASPWVKRGYVSGVHYDVPSVWRTIELLLGLPPRTGYTATAAPMFDIFATEPDYTPYTYVAANVPESFNSARGRLAEKSARMDFSTIDNAPGLGRLLWEHMKGEPAPWSSMPLPLDYEDEIELEVDEELGPPRVKD